MLRLIKNAIGIPQKQFCPICSSEVTFVSRYPNYVCRDCCKRIVDSEGRAIEFFNIDLSSGLWAQYADNQEPYDDQVCFIDGHRCQAREAHFGGVVVRTTKRYA